MHSLVLDNGAYAVKTCWCSPHNAGEEAPRVFSNAIVHGRVDRRVLVADDIENLANVSGIVYRMAFEKGYLTNWEAQVSVWERIFSQQAMNVETSMTNLIITEPCFNLPNIQLTYDQIVFEEYEFGGCARMTAPQLSSFHPLPSELKSESQSDDIPMTNGYCLVVDCGYSFTHIVPILNHQPVLGAIRRINVGGKILTNVLKETISFRHYNMMEETHLVNIIKERTCFVAENNKDFEQKLTRCQQYPRDARRNSVVQSYVLPNGESSVYGYVKDEANALHAETSLDEQVLPMNHERFTIPELLIHPSDIGIQQASIAEAIVLAMSSVSEEMHELLYDNIILIGGTARLPGLKARLFAELRPLVPTQYRVHISQSLDITIATTITNSPMTYAAEGGRFLVQQNKLPEYLITRREYEEYGSNVWLRRGLAQVSATGTLDSDVNKDQQSRSKRSRPSKSTRSSRTNDTSSTDFSQENLNEDDTDELSLSATKSCRSRASRSSSSKIKRRSSTQRLSSSSIGANVRKSSNSSNKIGTHSACGNCRYSHVSCSHTRPCKRCIRINRESSCANFYPGYRPPGI